MPAPSARSSLLQRLRSPALGLALAALFWSGNFIVGRALRGVIPPLSLNFWRWLIALAILLPFCWSGLRLHGPALLRAWKPIAALGLSGLAVFHTCVYQALVTTSAVNALLLLSLAPLLIALGAHLFYAEALSAQQGLGIAVSLAGAVTLIARGQFSHLLDLRFGAGDLWMLLAVLVWTVYSLLLRHRPAGVPQTVLLCACSVAAVLFMLPLQLWLSAHGAGWQVSASALASLLYVSLFASVLAFLFWNQGVAKLGPSRSGVFIHLMPVYGAALAFLFLGEGVQWFQWVGGALVFAGLALMNWQRGLA